MTRYRINNEAKSDLARIYWHGEERVGSEQADRYLQALFRRFEAISESPYAYQAVDHIAKATEDQSAAWIVFIIASVKGLLKSCECLAGRTLTKIKPQNHIPSP